MMGIFGSPRALWASLWESGRAGAASPFNMLLRALRNNSGFLLPRRMAVAVITEPRGGMRGVCGDSEPEGYVSYHAFPWWSGGANGT